VVGKFGTTRIIHEEIEPTKAVDGRLCEFPARAVVDDIGLNGDRSVTDFSNERLRIVLARRIVDDAPDAALGELSDDRCANACPAAGNDGDTFTHAVIGSVHTWPFRAGISMARSLLPSAPGEAIVQMPTSLRWAARCGRPPIPTWLQVQSDLLVACAPTFQIVVALRVERQLLEAIEMEVGTAELVLDHRGAFEIMADRKFLRDADAAMRLDCILSDEVDRA